MLILRLLLFLLLPFQLSAQFPERPSNYVTDEAGVLSREQEQALDSKLRDFEKKSSNQIFVYIASTLNGNTLEPFSQEIFQKWQIGSKGKDNGVLIAVFVKDQTFRIHTGYGLEGNLPDVLTKKIQDETMRPFFKQNDFYTGLDKGIDELIYYTAHAYSPNLLSWFSGIKNLWIAYALNAFLLITFLYDLFKKDPTKKRTLSNKVLLSSLSIIAALIPLFGTIGLIFLHYLITDKTQSKSYGSSGGSFRSSGSSSFSSGSGFSGGGGGRSGGGGSSSSW
jgi:uncharacterized protein